MGLVTFNIADKRPEPEPEQIVQLVKRLEHDKTDQALTSALYFFGNYSRYNQSTVVVEVVEGELGSGAQSARVIQANLPNSKSLPKIFQQMANPLLSTINPVSGSEVALAFTASSILYYGCVMFLDYEAGSDLFSLIEADVGSSDVGGDKTELLAHSLATSFQILYDTTVIPIGSIAPKISPDMDKSDFRRVTLASRLKPIIFSYLSTPKPMDEDFVLSACRELAMVELL